MSDKYQGFVRSPIGKLLVNTLGLPNPVQLERYVEGAPLVDGTIALGGRGRLAESLNGLLNLGISSTCAPADGGAGGCRRRDVQGLVFDATGLTSSADLVALRDFFTPLLRSLDSCPRVVVLGTPPSR